MSVVSFLPEWAIPTISVLFFTTVAIASAKNMKPGWGLVYLLPLSYHPSLFLYFLVCILNNHHYDGKFNEYIELLALFHKNVEL